MIHNEVELVRIVNMGEKDKLVSLLVREGISYLEKREKIPLLRRRDYNGQKELSIIYVNSNQREQAFELLDEFRAARGKSKKGSPVRKKRREVEEEPDFPEDDMEETYKIVTSIRSNSLKGKISIESPLGKALLGHKVGDTVTIEVDDSYSYDVEIRAIDESTDDAEDEIKSF